MRAFTALLSLSLSLSLGLSLPAPAAWADDGALRRCRALADTTVRLACYDALPMGAALSTGEPSAPVAGPPAAAFGLQRPDDGAQEIVSSIPGLFEGWRPGERIRLANGQLWQVTDDTRGVYFLRDPKATVRRAAMGSFVLDVDGARKLVRVRRLE